MLKNIFDSISARVLGYIAISPLVVAIIGGTVYILSYAYLVDRIPIGYVTSVIITIPLVNYFFEILEHRATGESEWPVLSYETLFRFERQLSFVLLFIVTLVIVVSSMLTAAGATALRDLLVVFSLFVLPVSAALLATTRNVGRAMNPIALTTAIVRLEVGYVQILLASIVAWFFVRRAIVSPNWWSATVAVYVMLVLAYFIGNTVYRYRRRLGVRTTHAPEDVAAAEFTALVRRRKVALAAAYAFASRENTAGAIAEIKEYSKEEKEPLDAELWLFQEMTRWHDPYCAYVFGEDLAERLTLARRENSAGRVKSMCELLKQKLQSI